MQFKKRFPFFTKYRQINGVNQIYPANEFREVIARERARSDRSGQRFAIVSFDMEKKSLAGNYARGICDILVCRKRATDEVGWVDDNHLGAILHNASGDEAVHFADAIRREFPHSDFPHLSYQIYIYPDEPQGKNEGKRNNSWQRLLYDKHDEDIAVKSEPQMLSGSQTLGLDSTHIGKRVYNSSNQLDEIQPLLFSGIPAWKRLVDIVGSLFGLIFLSPLFCVIAGYIKLVSPGPVLFKQERIGCCRRKFTIWKFRTMTHGADTSKHQNYVAGLINGDDKNPGLETPMIKLEDDSQIIPFGKFLRSLGLDELPQLFNVLCGEMSLVGPRPPIPYEVNEYQHWHNGRLDTLPGLTGLWQVSGKNNLSFTEMVRLDIRYARYLSFWLEMKILFMTPKAIFSQAIGNKQKEKF